MSTKQALIISPDRQHCPRGSSLVEIAIPSLFLMVVVFFCIDAYVWVQAFMVIDLACRDATRAAAQAVPPNGSTTSASYQSAAREAALSQLKLHIENGPYIKNPQLISLEWNDYGGVLPPPPDTPYVTCTTSLDVNLPVPVTLFGSKLSPDGKLVFKRAYTFPIINLRP